MGHVRTTRWATSSRTSPAQRPRACCTRWATTRSACRPRTPPSRRAAPARRHARATSPRSARRCSAWAGRSTGRASCRRPIPSTTAGRSGSSCSCSSAGWRTAARRPSTGARVDQTVLANEQVIDGALRALRRRGRGQDARAVVLQDHRLRRAAAGRHGDARGLARARADDAAQLDRPLARAPRCCSASATWTSRLPGLHDAARHAVRRDVLRAGARAPAGRRAGRAAPSTRRRSLGTCAAPPARSRGRARRRTRTKTGVFTGRTSSTRSTASRSRSGSPTTC